MTFNITGIGTAVPPFSIGQPEAARAWAALVGLDDKRTRATEALYRRSRIRKRHTVYLEGPGDPGTGEGAFFGPAKTAGDPGPTTEDRMKRFEAEAPGLAHRAAQDALAEAGVDAGQITHLVTVSCTGFFAPGPEMALIEKLGLPPTVERTNVGFMGCHGSLNGLRVAASFSGADPGAQVLMASVELCSLHMSYDWSPDATVANSLFADGAAAVVGMAQGDQGRPGAWRLASSGTCRLPDSADAMTWKIGNNGFRMTLSATVPEIIRRELRGWTEGWLAKAGLGVDQVESWAIHPGGPRILSSAAEALGLSPQDNTVSTEVLADFGNMSSATILFTLQRLRAQDAPRPCVAMAFGPGLVVEAALFV